MKFIHIVYTVLSLGFTALFLSAGAACADMFNKPQFTGEATLAVILAVVNLMAYFTLVTMLYKRFIKHTKGTK